MNFYFYFLNKDLIIAKIKDDILQRKLKSSSSKSQLKPYETGLTSHPSNRSINDASSDRSSPKPIEKPQPLPPVMNLEQYLDENKAIDVFVSAIANPHAFWVQLISEDSLKLDKQADEMAIFYDQNIDDYLFVS